MNSSNMSLKEGFDFLFEEADKSKKYEIIWNKDDVAPSNIKDCVAYILATDIVVSAIKNEDEPLILKLLREPGISKDIDYAQGRTISFSILKNKVKSFQGFNTFYDISNDNVKNIGVFNSIGQVYVQSVNHLVNSGATRMMLEAKQNVLKIDKARYLQMFRTFKTQSLIPKQKNQTKINFTKIYQSISSRIENEGLLKTSSKEGKYEKDEKYTELSDHEKAYEASVYFFKKLSTDQKRGFGGKKKIEDFLNLLSSRKETSVVDLVRQFKDSWNLKSKTVAKYIEKQFDEMIDSILGADSVAEAEDFLDEFANGFPTVDVTNVTPVELSDNIKQLETSKSQDDEPGEDKSDSDADKIASIIKGAQDLLAAVEEEEARIEAELNKTKTQDFTVAFFEKILKQLSDYANKISINSASLMLIFKHNKNFNQNATEDQKSELKGIIDSLNEKQKGTADVINDLLFGSKESDSIDNSEIESALTTVAFDPNTVSRIDFSEIAPDINQDNVVTKAKAEFEDMKTQIGDPTPQTDASSEAVNSNLGFFAQVFSQISESEKITTKRGEVNVEFNPSIQAKRLVNSFESETHDIVMLRITLGGKFNSRDKYKLSCITEEGSNAINKTLSWEELLNHEKIPNNIVEALKNAFDRGDEAKTAAGDQYKVTTTLSQPADGDYNDFLRKYLAIASFLAITTDSSSEILSDSARRLKASELVNVLEKWSKQAKVDNDVLSNSISNLAKFTNTNVEGIIFERAGANKYFIKMKAGEFASSSLLLQKQMKEDMPQNCFQFIQAFPTPVFELTDSKGEAFYPDITSALNHFMGTENQKRSLERIDDRIEFFVEEKRYFQLVADGVNYFFSLLGKPRNETLATENDQSILSVSNIFEPTATDICKYFSIIDSKNVNIIQDYMDEYAKTKVADFQDGLTEVDIDLSEDDAQTLVDAITTDADDSDDQPKTQTLVSKGKDKPEIKNNISSVEELSNDKVVRKMMSAIYRDGSLNNFLATMTPVEFAVVKAGKDKRLINDFKARAILAINPEIGAIKLNVKDIYNGEMKEVFDTLFSKNYNFNESEMRTAYTKTIVSAFDKLIGKEHSRITEGLFSGIKRMAAAGSANLLKMAPVLALVKAITFISFTGAAIPFIMAGFVSWITFSSWKNIAKWEQAKRDYQDDPYGYIEKTLFEDKSSRKVIKNIVNAAAADVIVARLNPVFAKQDQKSVTTGLSGGGSEFQKNFDEQMSEFSSLSDEDRKAAKALNDRVIGQLAKTKYYNSVITEAMINMVFNEVMFGKDRVSDETRKMLLDGNFDMQSDARKDLQDTLVSIIEKSAIKNNLVDFVHKEVKKLKNKRFTKADDAELERRKRYGSAEALDTTGMGKFAAAKAKVGAAMSDNVVGGMHAQYYISPEQIHEEAIDELVQKVVGLSKKEYEKRFEHNRNEDLFSENIIIGSLTNLLFEAPGDEQNDLDGESKEKSFKDLQDEREEANRQKDNTTAVLAGLGAGSYVHSLWLSMFMKKYADKQIVKTILQTIPGKAATAAKYVSKFSPDPASAADNNLLGQDMGHGLFEFTDNGVKKQLYAYFYSEAKYAGTPKALSGHMIDPTTGKATMIQHDLYSYYNDPTNNYYNKMWFNNHGMEVEPSGVVKVIDPNLCKALSANSPEMAKATNIIMTNLEASYPVETSAMEAKLKTFSIWSDFDEDLLKFAGKDKVAVVKAFAKKVMAQKLGGPDMGPHPVHFGDSDPEIKSFINVLERQLKAAAGDSPEAQKAVADAMGEFYKTCKTAVKGGEAFMQTLVKKGQSADAIFSPENVDALKSITDKEAKVMVQGFENSIETIKALVPEESIDVAFKKAVGMVAQQGHNPMLDFDVIPGQAGTAPGQNKIRGDYTAGGDKSWFNSLSKGVADYNSVVGPLALASKVLSKFYTRGIKSGELARQLTKMLNFKNIVYTDILNAILGNNIVSVPQGLTKDGHAENQSLSPAELLQSEGQVQNQGAVKITEFDPSDFEGEQAPAVPRSDEGYVYATKLSDYLFENKIVTKKKKTSKISSASLSLNEELEAHSHLKDLFKKLV